MDQIRRIVAHLSEDAIARTRLVLLGGEARGSFSIGPLQAFGAGFVTAIHDAMAGLDLLWHPASSEGLGTSLIDALALGVTPIAYNVGGVAELIEDRANGLLVPYGDVRGFADAHMALLAADARERLARAGPAPAALFAVERITQDT
jgi:glycosyltransferase involved in cell wall biosynthesis